ncbi:MAG TPA: hypothetical protein PLP39_07845 [Flavobacterium lutivivi]|nr:hypothetical protein [Flavobacterium lutivivi]
MKNHDENINRLTIAIKEKIGKPVSVRVVVATIESLGVRDIDVPDDYGLSSIRVLADLIYRDLTISPENIGIKNKKEIESAEKDFSTVQVSDYLMVKAKIFFEYYPKGIFHLFPVLLQILAIVVFGYSLWTYVGFNHTQSTAVVLGVIVGLVTSGGFVQVIGRQASFFWNHQDLKQTKVTVDYFIKLGVKSIFFVLTSIFVINSFLYLYPIQFLFVVFVYAFLIGLLLLIIAPVHVIKQRWVVSVAIFVATAVAIILKNYTILHIYVTHWIGIVVAIIISRLYINYYFKKNIKRKNQDSKIVLKTPVMLYHTYKYFFYGILLYVFIFIDRIIAWSSSNFDQHIPFLVYFEKNYELGMDLAILVFLLLAGVMEYSIAAFSKFIELGQKQTSYKNKEQYGKRLMKMYWQSISMLIITCIFIFILMYYIVTASWGYKGQFNEVLDDVTIFVGFAGGIGYFFLAWGMLNTLYLFTLSQPSIPLKALVFACIINLLFGFFLSRFVSYEYSVIGMILGAIIFCILTLKQCIKFFKNLDYYYYAAN